MVLYLLRAPSVEPFLGTGAINGEAAVVLLHDAVALREVPAPRVYVLAEDAASRGVSSAFQPISYKELMDLIFEADRVITV